MCIRDRWERLSPELERLGLLTVIDGEAFTAACQCWKTYVDCQRFLKKNGLTYVYTNSKWRLPEINELTTLIDYNKKLVLIAGSFLL